MQSLQPWILPPLLLGLSNIFMTFAWYGHLKFKGVPLHLVILASWGIAFIEYCLAVPANRIGHQVYSAPVLKTMQEVITLTVFVAFSVLYLRENLSPSQIAGFVLIGAGATLVIFKP
ncbi:MAG TPA: DMT family protein [Paracoccaceae bacterium]|nr:DMT family protein [Paracoccaceae bacterium]